MKILTKIAFIILSLWFISCNKGSESDDPDAESKHELSASPLSLNFNKDGGTETVSITSNYIWSASSNVSWCHVTPGSGRGNASISITTDKNKELSQRTATVTIEMADVDDIIISVSQEEGEFDPKTADHIDPDNTGMSSDAKVLASKINLGWNLVNTLEAIGGETAWGNPKTTNELIVTIKDAGFNAIRIPCSWDQYLEDQTSYTIKESWLSRVKEVVDYCVDNDLYAILNIHWDGGWMENNCTPEKQVEVNNKLAIIWKQIAIYFRDYDEHLLFAGANEPNAANQQEVNVLKVYMQTFVNVVRATGGRNSYRNLIIQAPSTDIDKANTYLTMPTDEIQNRLFAEVHYYTPWQFCGLEQDADWGNMFYFWGAPYHLEGAEGRYPNYDCEESFAINQFLKINTKLVRLGYPVILGEYGVIQRHFADTLWQEKHNESRAYFFETITREAKNKGLIPFCWDNGIFDRSNNTIIDSLSYNGLVKGAAEGSYSF